MKVLGIDVGGSGIKGALVDTKKGTLLTERYRIPTPQPATPTKVQKVVAQIVEHFNWEGPIGIGFPSVVLEGVIKTATNIDKSWVDVDAEALFSSNLNLGVKVINDADAAGLAEHRFGIDKKIKGTAIFLTVGTGIGSVLFSGKKLVPNTEFGHIFLNNGLLGEKYAADSIREKENLEWDEWGKRFNEYLKELEKLLNPKLFIIGGGISKKPEKFMHMINIETPVQMAKLKNEAGIIGAAIAGKKKKISLEKSTTEK